MHEYSIWGSGPQTDKHLPQSPFTGQLFYASYHSYTRLPLVEITSSRFSYLSVIGEDYFSYSHHCAISPFALGYLNISVSFETGLLSVESYLPLFLLGNCHDSMLPVFLLQIVWRNSLKQNQISEALVKYNCVERPDPNFHFLVSAPSPCRTGDLNSCPPDLELGALTKWLASRVVNVITTPRNITHNFA
jgi:hypothetical protein